MAGGSNQPGGTVSSKISLILLAVAEGSRTLTEIAGRSDLPLSTVHRLATELAAWGVLERTSDGRFRSGRPLRAIGWTGGTPCGSPGDASLSIREVAVPVMDDLLRAAGVRVRVGYFDDELEVAYVQKDSLYKPVSRDCAAARLPAHATALGKALLAFSSPRVINFVLSRGLRRYTPFTMISRESLHGAFKTIRATRLATCNRELEWASCGVAAPVFGPGGQVAAAIELHTLDLATAAAALRPVLTVAAGSLSRELAQHVGSGRLAARPLLARSPTLVEPVDRMLVDGA